MFYNVVGHPGHSQHGFSQDFFTFRRDALWMNHPGEVQSSGYLIHSLDNFKHFSKQPHPQTYVFKTITIILKIF